MVKTINSIIVGVGFIGKQHIEAISRIPNTKIIALVESSLEIAKRNAAIYGIDYAFSDLDEALKLDHIDVVHICTPNFLHYEMAKKVIEKGLNVFCEKPLSLSAGEAIELAELARKHQVHTAVNHNYRANAMVREMKHRIQSGSIGRPLMVFGQYVQDWLMFEDDYDWHFDPKLVGPSRSVADIGTHLFDLIQFTMDQKITRVFAELVFAYPIRKKSDIVGETFSDVKSGETTDVEVVNEDGAFIIAELENGVKVSMVISQVTGGFKNGLELTISGSKQSLTWRQEQADKLEIGKRDSGNEILYADAKYLDKSLKRFIALPNGHAVGWADAFKNSIQEFYLEIMSDSHSDSKSSVDFEDGAYLMKLVEASLLSDQEKRWVTLK